MAKKIERKIDLGEARAELGVPSEWIGQAAKALGLELELRAVKTVTKAELQELERWLAANMPSRWYVAYRAEDGVRSIDLKEFDTREAAMGHYSSLKRSPGQVCPPFLAISREQALKSAPAMLGMGVQ